MEMEGKGKGKGKEGSEEGPSVKPPQLAKISLLSFFHSFQTF